MPHLDERTRPWWTLVGTCAGLFLLMLDSTVVALALSEIESDLDAGADSLQWIMNGYLLVITVLVVTAGRLGDIFGRKLVFLIGLVLFAAGSVLAGAAWDDLVVVLARLVQGAGAAAVLGLSLAIVSNAFPPERQARALGIWAAVSAIALAIGPLVGGALVELDWRLIFWINLPVCLVGFAVTLWAAPESRDETSSQRIDWPGLYALSFGLAFVVLGLVESDSWGWDAPLTLGLIAGGLVLLWVFYLVERRVREPIVDFSLFRNRPYLGATAAAFALVGAYWTVMFFQPQLLQKVLGYSPVEAGLLILPITVPMVLISPLAGRLISWFGPRGLMTFGLVCGAVGLALLTRVDSGDGFGALAPGYALFGVALGCVYAPMNVAAMAAMPREKAGIAAGVLAMNRVMAGAVGLALSGAIFQSVRSDRLADGDGEASAFASALGLSTWVLVAMVAVGAVATWILLRSATERGQPGPSQHHMAHRRFHL